MKTTIALSGFLERLRTANISHQIRETRDEAVSVDVAVPGERWEIDFLNDGSVEVEIFRGDGTIGDESLLDDLFERFAD